ncbi:MAG TPA: hypothetical protein VHX64_01390, partial [Caulobacteraceae bacterium]|nr:hypothetical protein [Caulobacteraceae bacterium]
MVGQKPHLRSAGRTGLHSRASIAAIAAGLAMVAAVPGAAWAQAAGSSASQTPPANAQGGGTQLQEVVVTAQFRSENLQKTPISITAVNAAQIENRSYSNILD